MRMHVLQDSMKGRILDRAHNQSQFKYDLHDPSGTYRRVDINRETKRKMEAENERDIDERVKEESGSAYSGATAKSRTKKGRQDGEHLAVIEDLQEDIRRHSQEHLRVAMKTRRGR